MTEKTNDRDVWLSAGWERGSIIPITHDHDISALLHKKIKDEIERHPVSYLIPILYDCALIDDDFDAEPWVQLLVCWPIDRADGNYKFGKNPRKYHFEILIDDVPTCLEVSALGICQIERELLLAHCVPSENIKWGQNGLSRILHWVSERYKQPTFPDEWNNRKDVARKLFEKFSKDTLFNDFCSGVYVNITPFEEIGTDDIYNVNVYLSIPEDVVSDGRALQKFNKEISPVLIEKVGSAFKIMPNVNIGNVDTLVEGEFTKETERKYKRMSLEYYSFKRNPEGPLPAETIA